MSDVTSVCPARVALIVNADDYGLTHGTNRGIERAHTEGVLTSTSVMVNQGASQEVEDLRARCPELGIGIHLTLTLGEPACEPARVRSLLDQDGRLVERNELLRRMRGRALVTEDVARECTAQLERMRSLGIEPDHWNVHQHVQEYEPIAIATAAAMAQAGLRVARNPLRVPIQRKLSAAGVLAALRARRRRPGWQAIARRQRMPQALLDARPDRWIALAGSLPGGIVEAICHPAERDPALERLTPTLTSARADELEALLAPGLREALRVCGVSTSTFAAAFRD